VRPLASLKGVLRSGTPNLADSWTVGLRWAYPRIDLALCGHTHGGQIRVPFLGTPVVPSDYGQKYAGGLIPADVCAAACPVIVSRGIGTSILPVRIGVPPEVVVIDLYGQA